MHSRSVCVIPLVLSIAACMSEGDGTQASVRERLRVQRAKFVEPESYSFTESWSCYCDYTPVRVSVTNGVVTGATEIRVGLPQPRPPVMADTMPELFDIVSSEVKRNSGWEGGTFDIEFDAELHYLTRYTRRVYDISDANLELTITDFTVPADAPPP